ncbi:MAG: tRNA (guanosine(37)-N1)-methyltransferase TrmD [Desulfovermiculus sp.]|nr:tRNA (guanosine(37)-N1)-methyltransferase TrmD [Desulfovermiculus sp.]
MHFNILTIFPQFFDSPLECGLMGKARERGIFTTSLINPRDFTPDRHRSVDDRPYGGGPGMVMSLQPLLRAMDRVSDPGRVVLLSPRGRPFDQELARDLAGEETLTLVCGRYEGIDARFVRLTGAEPVSIGDFVLNGGESAALCLLEAVTRLQSHYMGCEESTHEESFASGLLEYPHFTRPQEYNDLQVPSVLLSGDHARIAEWRREKALLTTKKYRPDLLEGARLSLKDMNFLRGQTRTRLGRNLYVALLHWPVMNKQGQITSVSLTNLDIHDIARVCHSYGLGGYYLTTPLQDQQALAARLLAHWRTGQGRAANPDRTSAVQGVKIAADVDQVVEQIEEHTGMAPRIVATSARAEGEVPCSSVRGLLEKQPVLLLLGTGSGLAPQILTRAEDILRPIRCFDTYNHLSVRSAAAILIDRILGDIW